jgi:hypothetical protein
MIWFRVVCLFFVVLCVSNAAEWTEVSSRNFYLMTTAGSADARRTIEYFEQVHGFFVQARDVKLDTKLPVTIVLFRGDTGD